jgi:hypothetical protein
VTRSLTPAPSRARAADGGRASRRRLAALALALLGCRPGAEADVPAGDVALPPLPVVDHGEPPPYAGAWVGPELSLSFVGPWVLVRPSGPEGEQAAPIELRVTVERREGDAFALRTSIAGVLPADFLRPTDWTMLVEEGQLAIAMGDEPLTAYTPPQSEAPDPLLGPAMLDELELPEELVMADAVACLEFAGDRCAEIEADGPLAAGCREMHWAACVAHLGPVSPDPTVRAAKIAARRIHIHALSLRFTAALLEAADPAQHAAAEALHHRAQTSATKMLDELRRDGPLPQDDPHLPGLLAALEP